MIDALPAVNACLNAASAILLLAGRRKARAGKRIAHKRLMISAFAVSSLFLVSYITYHAFHGTTRFPGSGFIRPVYFAILGSHTLLAAAVVPLVLISLARGLKDRIPAHRNIARIAYPVWLYVSVTGVIIYIMLYRLF